MTNFMFPYLEQQMMGKRNSSFRLVHLQKSDFLSMARPGRKILAFPGISIIQQSALGRTSIMLAGSTNTWIPNL
jgi:hypothetical protein